MKRIFFSLIFFCAITTQKIHTTIGTQKKIKGSSNYATILLMNEKSEVLLLHRKGTAFGDGLYSLPGGKIEDGETALEAAVREAKEEVGIDVTDLDFIHVVDRRGADEEFFIFTFKVKAFQGEPKNCETHKCDYMSWVALTELPDNIIPGHRQAIILSQQNNGYSLHGY